MAEKDIILCGHGSGTPSTKNCYDYLETRYKAKWDTSNKGLVEVRRFLNSEQAKMFAHYYEIIIGRNLYDQNKRQYVFDRYTDGKYYSDCSSSGCACYKKCGKDVWLNTAGMHTNGQLVNVEIKNGHIMNPDILQPGDALLFRGNKGRPLDIGHVEYVMKMPTTSSLKNGWVKENSNWYYYKNGVMQKKQWIKYNSNWYRVGNDGKMLIGTHKIYDEKNVLSLCYFGEGKDDYGKLYHERSDHSGYLEVWNVK